MGGKPIKLRLGIDLGGTSAKIGIVDGERRIVERTALPTGADIPFQEMIRRLAEALRSMMGKFPDQIAQIGLGIPSSIAKKNRIVVHANNLGWRNRDAISELKRYVDLPVYLANDADCAALGEFLAGAGQGYDYVLLLTLGTGLGGGIIDHGKLFLGGNGCGFEPGHMIIRENGLACTCGRRGCLERYASATALIREVEQAAAAASSDLLRSMIAEGGGKANAKMAFDATAAGDVIAGRILEEYLHSLAVGISNLITLFRPNVVILGGGVSAAGEALFRPLRQWVGDMTYGAEVMGCPPIIPAELGNDAGIIGAAFLEE